MIATPDLAAQIVRRAARADVPVGPELAARLTAYLELLSRWNKKINLTGLDVDRPSDDAIDRLIVEPLAAVRYLRPDDQLVLDIGSGGGSPALPMKLAAPAPAFVLVESKLRKAAFLREAIRQLGVGSVRVENTRVEELASHQDLTGRVDVVTIRAVRMDDALMRNVQIFLRPAGRVFAFVGVHDANGMARSSELMTLVPALDSRLVIFGRYR